jgi:integrase
VTPRWRVYVVPARKNSREKGLYLRAKLALPGQPTRDQRLATHTADPAKAEQLRQVFEADLNAGLVIGDLEDPVFLAVFDARLRSFEQDGDTARNTLRSYQGSRAALAACSLAVLPASKIDRAAILRARDELKATRKPSTVNLYLAHAQAAWHWARERGLVSTDWPHVKRLRAKPTEKRPFTDGEIVVILRWFEGYLGGKWLPLFALLADSSERIGAVLKLRGRDVDRDACEIIFRRTKTTSQKRAIPPATIALLPTRGPDELIFPGIRLGRPVRQESVRDNLRRAMRAVGITDPEWLSIHSFRRAWVATSQRVGVPIPVAMKHTGHTDVKVFHGYQRNTVGDDMHEAARRVHEARERALESLPPAARKPVVLPGADPEREVLRGNPILERRVGPDAIVEGHAPGGPAADRRGDLVNGTTSSQLETPFMKQIGGDTRVRVPPPPPPPILTQVSAGYSPQDLTS